MALVLADRVLETTTTTGTGTMTLAGAVSGYQSFAVIGNGNTTYYTITSGTEWEVGIGTYTAAGTLLARTTILSSSAAGAAITLAGTSKVFVTYPSEKSVNQAADGSVTIIPTPGDGSNIQLGGYNSGTGGTVYGGFTSYNNDGYTDGIGFNYARGTITAPLAVQAGDAIENIYFAGYDGSSFLFQADTITIIDGAVSAGVVPMALTFRTGASGTPTERLRISSAGNVGIGTSSPGAKLDINGAMRLSASTFFVTLQGSTSATASATYTLPTAAPVSNGYMLTATTAGVMSWTAPATGTVTSVGFTGGIVSVATATTTPAFTVAGTSGGIPYFSSATTWATSAALAANALVVGGGAGVAPATVTTGTGVVTALGVNIGSAGAFVTFNGALGTPSSGTLTSATGLPISTGVSGLGTGVATALAVNTGTAGAFVVNGGALGTPSSGTVTNLTGTASININGTVGATTPAAGSFTTLGWTGVTYTSAGSAQGATITDYFTSTISLDASSIYEIDAVAYFLKTTAGTVIWTWTFSSAPDVISSFYNETPITGFTTTINTNAPVNAQAAIQTSTTLAHAASGSLSNAAYHLFRFRVLVKTNAATTIQLRSTQSSGTLTPQAGSYMRATKVL